MWSATETTSLCAAAWIFAFGGLAGETSGQQKIEPRPASSLDQGSVGPQVKAPVPVLNNDELSRVVRQTRPPVALDPAETRALNRVSGGLRSGDYAGALKEWSYVVERLSPRLTDEDVNALVRYVLRATYLESSQALRTSAERVKRFNEQKEAAREYIRELRQRRAELDRVGDPKRTVPVRPLTLSNADDKPSTLRSRPIDMTPKAVAEELQRVVVLADSAEKREQMAKGDLQSSLQRQQGSLQTMSNVSKLLNDAAKSVIRRNR